jgi:hypothetical protein
MGQQTASVATLTRPADTTAYTSGDSVANSTSAPTPIEFTGLGRSGVFTGTLYGVEMDDQNNAGTPGEFELWLFSSSPTIANDNAAAAISWAASATLVAVVPLYASYLVNAGSGNAGVRRYESAAPIGRLYATDANGSLWGALVARSSYTPLSAEIFRITVRAEIAWA